MAASYPTGQPAYDFPFAAIPHSLIGDERLGHTEVRAYAVLVWMAWEDSDREYQFSHAEVARRMCCSERSVARPLAKLVETGWIEREEVRTGHGRMADRFVIHRERDSHRADLRAWVEANRADLRGRDHADLRGPTTPKEVREDTQPSLDGISTPSRQPTESEIKADFAEWYKVYPKKKKPDAAERAYIKARKVKKASAEELLKGARALALLIRSQGGDTTYVPYPATWLNDGQWKEDLDGEIQAEEERRRRSAEQQFTGPEQRFV